MNVRWPPAGVRGRSIEGFTVSKLPAAQRDYLRRPFEFGCSTAAFPPDELTALAESGALLEALAAGEVEPATADQKHFLKVDREEAEPETLLERAWERLKARREYEHGQPVAESPAEDYDMVEFDADRCWW
jgi:uncharacterized protein YifE (UPF0438 family)